jgi:hypothetical protein
MLINRGADVHYMHRYMHGGNSRSIPPLIRAAFKNHANVVSGGGPMSTSTSHAIESQLLLEAQYGQREAAICPLDYGADVSTKDSITLLAISSSYAGLLYIW